MLGSREQFVRLWRSLAQRVGDGDLEAPALPLLRALASDLSGCESFLRASLGLAVFSERGLLSVRQKEEYLLLRLTDRGVKVDLYACPYLDRLSSILTPRN